ncbi:MAG: class I SAM-dependent methyltransferase [Candidatus Atribacteria bacterium]|nr:MAG: class I SAM-dependent methyltransferase [Candidatus Atribacteria bacterium]
MSQARNHCDAESKNRAMWDEVAPVHLRAYGEVAKLREGREFLDDIELREVGDVKGKSLLHLQCHIGTDTLAWARRGATATGVDFSGESIACARQLAKELDLSATFIHANIYDVRSVHDERYDIVYTSKGVLCWLRDLPEWGRIIAHYLNPGGFFYLMESHPVIMALEEEQTGNLAFRYPYFHKDEPTRWPAGDHDYADGTYIRQNESAEWEWSVSDIVNALIDAGLQLEFVNEYEKLFFQMFPSMTIDDGGWYRLPQYSSKLPLLLTLRARKPA